MIAKIFHGKDFMGAARYVLGKEKSQYVCGTLVGKNIVEIGDEIRKLGPAVQNLPRMVKPVFHESINLFPGERFEPKIWEKVVREHMEVLGFSRSPWFAARHSDKPHDHVHVVALRINSLDYKTVDSTYDAERAAWHLHGVAGKYGLTLAPTNRIDYFARLGITPENYPNGPGPA